MRWIPGIDVDRAELRTTLTYRFSPRFTAGVEYNPLADDVGPIANWVAVTETEQRPAIILGTSSDRIGTPSGRAVYATASKSFDVFHLPVAPYAGVSYGTFDDQAVAIGGLSIQWLERLSSTHMWDGYNLHHIVEVALEHRQTLGLVVVDLDGAYSVGAAYTIGF